MKALLVAFGAFIMVCGLQDFGIIMNPKADNESLIIASFGICYGAAFLVSAIVNFDKK